MFKAIKKMVGILLGVIALALVACAPDAENSTPDTGNTPVPTLSETSIELFALESVTLTVDNYDGTVEWSVSDYRVIEVVDGVVTCVGVGEATVTAQAGKTTLTCRVIGKINYVPVPYIVLEGEVLEDGRYALSLLLNDTYELDPVLYLAGEKVENVSFTLTAENAAVEVEGLTVKAVAATAETTVFLTCEYEGKSYTATCAVTVSEV